MVKALVGMFAVVVAACSFPHPEDELEQRAYVKASNTGSSDLFGHSVALSADGSTLAVGAVGERSGTADDPANDTVMSAGAVYVLVRQGATWRQQAYVKASSVGMNNEFGYAVALSGDGSMLAVGAPGVGIGSGAVDVFVRQGATWGPGKRVEVLGLAAGDAFGESVALSEDGSTLAVGAKEKNGDAGAVYVFSRDGTTWGSPVSVQASNSGMGQWFGISVALSSDGSTLAVGASIEDSGVTGINGNPAGSMAKDSGAAYVFTRNGLAWRQQAYIKASNTGSEDHFGDRNGVALSGDGSTLAVGAYFEFSAATGVDGDQANNSALGAGAAYLFTRRDTTWSQQAYLKASNTGAQDSFGRSVSLSRDGSTLAVGASLEDSAATEIDGEPSNNSAEDAGAAYLFTRKGTTWSQRSYVKASNANAQDWFGNSIALSGDGAILAAGAQQEDSAAAGIDGDQASNSAAQAGAVYVFH